jgi:CxxC motif-containing protein
MGKQEKRKIICVRCPRGCEITTTLDGYSIVEIEGNVCNLGREYVTEEVTDPRRIVTTTVKVKNGDYPLVPVWTNVPVPKDEILKIMDTLREIELEAPVEIDQVVVKNILDTKADVITSSKVFRIAE